MEDAFDDANRRLVCKVPIPEVKEVLKKIMSGKTMGPDSASIELWRSLGNVALGWLTTLFNKILQITTMLEWRKRTLVPIYKSNGEIFK